MLSWTYREGQTCQEPRNPLTKINYSGDLSYTTRSIKPKDDYLTGDSRSTVNKSGKIHIVSLQTIISEVDSKFPQVVSQKSKYSGLLSYAARVSNSRDIQSITKGEFRGEVNMK